VIQVLVSEGQAVQTGDVLVIIEAMKMEHRIEAPARGTITEIFFAEGQMVQADEVLVGLA
jgi:3-methylcrotonyl-CoA carboxylase alpha subunit